MTRSRIPVAGLLAAALVVTAGATLVPAHAAPGDLDPTFGSGGKTTTDFGRFDQANDLAVQPDGKIVAAGSTCCRSAGDFALARYNPEDGTLDTGFGSCPPLVRDPLCSSRTGTVTTDFSDPLDVESVIFPSDDRANGVAIQGDGKIVAAGSTCCDTRGGLALARYNADGTLDTSFGNEGKVISAFGLANDVAVQTDGNIVVAGRAGGDFALARYNPDGMLDTSFGDAGKVTTDFFGGSDEANELVIQPDGKIVAVGASGNGNFPAGDFAVARYNPDGTLDNAFGTAGKVSTDFGGTDRANGVVIQDGSIIAAGSRAVSGPGTFFEAFALARYKSDGTLDAAFGDKGKIISDFYGIANDVTIANDGKIVVAGTNNFDFVLASYNADGTDDTLFGSGGNVSTDFDPADHDVRDTALGVVIQEDGKIVAAGSTEDLTVAETTGRLDRNFALARYLPGEPNAPVPGSIAGAVSGGNGKNSSPIANATVDCGAAGTATTATDGGYRIANVTPDTYSCTASAAGFDPATKSVSVAPGEESIANFTLRKSSGGDPSPSPSPSPTTAISLSANGYKQNGLQKADLSWSGAGSQSIDVYRNGVLIVTTENDESHTDNIDARGGGSYTYKICEQASSICSNEATVTF